MSQVGCSVELGPDAVRVTYSTPEQGAEYQIVYTRADFAELVRSHLLFCMNHPDMAGVIFNVEPSFTTG